MNTFFNRFQAILFFVLFLLAVGNQSVIAQQEKEKDSLNPYSKEWNLNAFNLLIFQALDVSFEKYIDEESSFGVTGLISLAGNNRFNEDAPFYYETLALSPFYRVYFGRGANKGFFIEAFGSFSLGKYDNYDYYYYDPNVLINSVLEDPYDSFTAIGLGFSLGGKFITKDKFTLSVYAGAARNFISSEGPGAFPRAGINIGKRF